MLADKLQIRVLREPTAVLPAERIDARHHSLGVTISDADIGRIASEEGVKVVPVVRVHLRIHDARSRGSSRLGRRIDHRHDRFVLSDQLAGSVDDIQSNLRRRQARSNAPIEPAPRPG